METSSPPTSMTLLGQLRLANQPAAWGQFDRLYRPLLVKWASRHGFGDADADDLAQEVLVKLMAELPSYERGPGQSFRGWLFRITVNVGHDFRRRRATRALPDGDGLSQVDDGAPLAGFEEAEYRKALVDGGLKTIRGEFAEKTWTAFERLMMQNCPAAEVAAELGMTRGAVYSAQSRILARLREVIDEFLD